MEKKILPCIFICLMLFSAKAQQNCFDEYSGTYKLRGGVAIPDGLHKVVVAIEDSRHYAQCVQGKIVTKNNAIVLPLYVLRENGSYSQTYGSLDNHFYRQMEFQINFDITDAMTPVFMLTDKRKARLFFPDFVNENPGTTVAAPSAHTEKKVEPKAEDLDKIKMSAKSIQFESGKAVITKGSYSMLDLIAELMKNYPDNKWSIDGFTDNTGSESSNYILSEKRAVAVEDYLIEKGVKAENLFAAGHGPVSPIADNSTASGRQQNRRVEIKPL